MTLVVVSAAAAAAAVVAAAAAAAAGPVGFFLVSLYIISEATVPLPSIPLNECFVPGNRLRNKNVQMYRNDLFHYGKIYFTSLFLYIFYYLTYRLESNLYIIMPTYPDSRLVARSLLIGNGYV